MLLLLGLLGQQLVLQCNLLFHLLALDAVFSFGCFPLEREPRVLAHLGRDEKEHRSEDDDRQNGLGQATLDDPVRHRTDALADDIVSNQVGEEPVRSLDGGIAQGLGHAVVCEGGNAPVAFGEIAQKLVIRVSRVEFGVC